MNQVLPIDTVIKLALCKLYELTAVQGVIKATTETLTSAIGHGVSKGLVTVAIGQMYELRWVSTEPIPNASFRVQITPAGAREAEKELRDPRSLIYRYQREGWEALQASSVEVGQVPASDRFVDASHNQKDRESFADVLGELEQEIRTSNEAGEIFGDDRVAALEEISALKKLASGVRVRALVVLQLARSSMSWIAEKAAGAAIGELAKKALTLAISWLAH